MKYKVSIATGLFLLAIGGVMVSKHLPHRQAPTPAGKD